MIHALPNSQIFKCFRKLEKGFKTLEVDVAFFENERPQGSRLVRIHVFRVPRQNLLEVLMHADIETREHDVAESRQEKDNSSLSQLVTSRLLSAWVRMECHYQSVSKSGAEREAGFQ